MTTWSSSSCRVTKRPRSRPQSARGLDPGSVPAECPRASHDGSLSRIPPKNRARPVLRTNGLGTNRDEKQSDAQFRNLESKFDSRTKPASARLTSQSLTRAFVSIDFKIRAIVFQFRVVIFRPNSFSRKAIKSVVCPCGEIVITLHASVSETLKILKSPSGDSWGIFSRSFAFSRRKVT